MAQKSALQFSLVHEHVGPPRCLSCGYCLDGLHDPKCPECGRSFDPADPTTFDRRPIFRFWHYWAPGLALALVVGLFITIAFLMAGDRGITLTIGAPVLVGAILGYGIRFGLLVRLVLALFVLASVGFAVFGDGLAGMFFVVMLMGMMLLQLAFGAFLGCAVQSCMKHTAFSQRWYLP